MNIGLQLCICFAVRVQCLPSWAASLSALPNPAAGVTGIFPATKLLVGKQLMHQNNSL